jgi:uncharacterized protein (DUF3084 family)
LKERDQLKDVKIEELEKSIDLKNARIERLENDVQSKEATIEELELRLEYVEAITRKDGERCPCKSKLRDPFYSWSH